LWPIRFARILSSLRALVRHPDIMPTAIFIRHRALPGRRDDVRRIWEKYVQPRAAANPAHEAYHYCFADGDPDTILVYQQYPDRAASEAFTQGPWYRDYLAEVSQFVAHPPQIETASVFWAKSAARP
jgi:quinol monooxygenase YgiN